MWVSLNMNPSVASGTMSASSSPRISLAAVTCVSIGGSTSSATICAPLWTGGPSPTSSIGQMVIDQWPATAGEGLTTDTLRRGAYPAHPEHRRGQLHQQLQRGARHRARGREETDHG